MLMWGGPLPAQVRGVVAAAGLLTGLGLPTAPAALLGVGPDAALALVRTLLARLARSSPPPSDARCAGPSADAPDAGHILLCTGRLTPRPYRPACR
jgi:hypothetical protein